MARRVAILAGWAKPACWDAGGRRSTLWEQPAPWLLGIETLPATRTREEQARIARLWGGLTCISARARADLAFAAEGRPVCAHCGHSARSRGFLKADVRLKDVYAPFTHCRSSMPSQRSIATGQTSADSAKYGVSELRAARPFRIRSGGSRHGLELSLLHFPKRATYSFRTL